MCVPWCVCVLDWRDRERAFAACVQFAVILCGVCVSVPLCVCVCYYVQLMYACAPVCVPWV